MMKHTEGPWHVGMKPGPIVYGPNGEQIADCQSKFLDRSTNGYNARLIALAPEMKGLLRDVSKFCPVYVQDTIAQLLSQVEGTKA